MSRVLIRPNLKLESYELYKEKKPNISHIHVFGYKCFVLNNMKDNLEQFDPKDYECLFLGYSASIEDFRIFNERTMFST